MMLRNALPLLAGAVVAVGIAASFPRVVSAENAACDGWDVGYALAANLRLADTMMGAADGVYPVGPGNVVLHFDMADREGHIHAKLLSYNLHQRFRVASKSLFGSVTVTTDAHATLTPDGSAVPVEGVLDGHTLRWSGAASGYRSDAAVVCDGSLCGKFGAPPSGSSSVHLGPAHVTLEPFQFSTDMKTFVMQDALMSKMRSPKQSTYVSLSGREVRRTCVQAPAAPPST
jgi:hypothetical protein